MKSPITGNEMLLVSERDVWNFRGEEYPYTHKVYLCEESGERYTTTELDMESWNEVTGAYRKKHNIPSREELISLRKKLNLSLEEIEKLLGLNSNRYKEFEMGEVPTLEENVKIKMFIQGV